MGEHLRLRGLVLGRDPRQRRQCRAPGGVELRPQIDRIGRPDEARLEQPLGAPLRRRDAELTSDRVGDEIAVLGGEPGLLDGEAW